MPFEKGKSGNPKGRGKDKHVMTALMLEMKQREANGDHKGMRRVAGKVWDLAEEGERWAVEFIRDTIDGKPAQQINHANEDGEGPVSIVFKTVYEQK